MTGYRPRPECDCIQAISGKSFEDGGRWERIVLLTDLDERGHIGKRGIVVPIQLGAGDHDAVVVFKLVVVPWIVSIDQQIGHRQALATPLPCKVQRDHSRSISRVRY